MKEEERSREEFGDKRVRDLTSEDVLDIVVEMRDMEELDEKNWVGVLDMAFLLHNHLTDEGLRLKYELIQQKKGLEEYANFSNYSWRLTEKEIDREVEEESKRERKLIAVYRGKKETLIVWSE